MVKNLYYWLLIEKVLENKEISSLSDNDILMLVKIEVRGLANPVTVMENIKEYRKILQCH